MRTVVWAVARKETLELVRDRRFRWMCAGLLALLATASWVGWMHYARAAALREVSAGVQRQEWLNKGAMHPHMAAHYGTFLFKPIPPLFALDPGVDPQVGSLVFLEAHRQNGFAGRPALDAPSPAAIGEVTVAATLQLLVPLLIVLLTFSAFSGEREQQTLPLAVSSGVRPIDLALGKTIGLAFPLGCVCVPAAVLGLMMMVIVADDQTAWMTWPRLAAWLALYLTYFAIVATIGLVVSITARTSREALVMLLALWSLNGVVIPRAAIDMATRARPTPGPTELEARINEDLAKMPPFGERVTQVTDRLVREQNLSSAEELAVDPRGVALAEAEAETTAIHRRHTADLVEGYRRQERLYDLLGLLAPSLALERLSMTISGTDLAHHRRFADAAEEYRLRFVQELNQAIAVNDEIRLQPGDDTLYARYLGDRMLWEQVPPFTYEMPTLGWALGSATLPLVSMAVWGFVSPVAVLVSARRLRAA
jgi:ABC-2 type transport system permease protein